MNNLRDDNSESVSPGSPTMKKEAREIVGGLFSAWRELRGLGIPFDQAAVLHEAKMLNLPQDPTALAELLAAIPDNVPDGVAERDWRLFHAAITKLAAEWRQMPTQSPAKSPRAAAPPGPALDPMSRAVVCRECGTSNPPNRNFCSQCGAGLWCICPGCKTRVPGDETFCGVCGYLIGEELAKYAARVRGLIARAEELIGQGKPWDADACLQQIPRGQLAWYEHAQFLRKIEHLEAALKPLLERRKEKIEGVLAEAAELAQTGDFDGSITVLERLHRDFHTPEVQAALERYRRSREQLVRLERELGTHIQKKDLPQTLQTIRSLLALKPNHPAALDVGSKLRPIVKKMAEKYVANNRFIEAVQLLDAFPEAIYDADLSAQKAKAVTLQALVGLVRSAHYVYPYLPSMMENLSELLPPNHAPIFSAEELANLHAPLESPRVWSRRIREAKTSALGPPIEWITGFRRINAAENVDADLLRNRHGAFLAAAGAALQGLGAAVLNFNLVPADSLGMIGRISRWLRPKVRSAWGVALGGTALRAIRIERVAATGDLLLTHLDYHEYPKPLSHAANRGQMLDMFKDALQAVLDRQEAEADQLVLALPPTLTVTTTTLLPPFDPERLQAILAFEAKRLLPDRGENMIQDFANWPDRTPAKSAATNTCVVLAAVHRLLFSEAAERIRSVNVVPDVVTTETAALLNFVITEYLPHVESSGLSEKPGTNGSPSQHAELPLLIIEAGSSFSQAYYMAADLVKFYGLGIAGESWIRGIAKELKLTYTAAAKRSHDERQTDDLGRIYPFLQQFRRQAFDDVQRVLERIRGEELEPPRTILVTGEAACIPGLIDGWITGCS